jgi:hypothetical protein
MSENPIVIRKGLKLGELDAETDRDLMLSCFVDKGEFARLAEVTDPASIILGRTGSGKSALLQKIFSDVEHATILNPHDISVQFLEHSNIISFFNELGVKLDLFYRILWRHIMTMEFIKLRYNLRSEQQSRGFLTRLYNHIAADEAKKKALDYFSEWGHKFWLETDEHLRELTSKLTRDVEANLKSKFPELSVTAKGARSLTEEQRTEVKSLATKVVDGIQIKRLNEVLEVLAEYAFCDPQKKYFLLLDQLDEDWAETETRCRFIRALIEETRAMRRVPQIKIISALRQDLLETVFEKTRGSGFQEEKYESSLLQLQWSRVDLHKLIELRVKEVFRRQYPGASVGFADVFPKPKKGGEETPLDYVVDRTLRRPRDILQFFNLCLLTAADRPRVSWRAIQSAEAIYSGKRLGSLKDEWADIYPALGDTLEVLRGITSPFTRSAISGDRLNNVSMALHEGSIKDPCVAKVRGLYSTESPPVRESDVVSQLLKCLYHVGAIGIKISSRETLMWSTVDQPRVTNSEVKRASNILVHKMLHQALEIIDRET